MKFTTHERSIIEVFYSGTRAGTAYEIQYAMPCFNDPAERRAAANVLSKLEVMSDREFNALFSNFEAAS